jgi:serine/threonine-protein kinase HSL1 (negative regulator of Swe1 kinase)
MGEQNRDVSLGSRIETYLVNATCRYLVLEFVDNGELFDYISKNGCLHEEEALKYFRQLLSAVGYCHSFNICHRDLKPENVLLTSSLDVKVADFGMAALHQTPEHRLSTSCGSPHYAAPEVIKGVSYKGNLADIWSMGIILFASVAGYLPFDHEDIPTLLESIKRGRYKMASHFSAGVADLVHRMLQVNPRDRISVSQIWRHPLLRKYDYLDDYGRGYDAVSPKLKTSERLLLRRSDIDRDILRHLRSMWHMFEEQQIINLLLSDQ